MQWNTIIRDMIQSYIKSIVQTDTISVPFVILQWPSWLGKREVARDMALQITWLYAHQDCKILEDHSDDLWKLHLIKVSEDELLEFDNGGKYQDEGIVEVSQWMIKSPAWSKKVLIIENAERMNDYASNALLKMLEEPLPWRIIIATTSQPNQLLATIFSRALIFSFYPTDDTVALDYASKLPIFQQYDPTRVSALAAGRPGLLDELAEDKEWVELLWVWFQKMQQYNSIHELYNALLAISNAWYDKLFFQANIYWFAKKWLRHVVTVLQQAYRLLDENIKNEHILFDFVMQYNAASRK